MSSFLTGRKRDQGRSKGLFLHFSEIPIGSHRISHRETEAQHVPSFFFFFFSTFFLSRFLGRRRANYTGRVIFPPQFYRNRLVKTRTMRGICEM